ncbi:MAG: hypothetical protein RLZZ187_2985 [Pseudomonadota bacterium]|jgi:hypothetical protein
MRPGGWQRLRLAARLGAWIALGLLVLLAIAFWAGGTSAPPSVRIGERGVPPAAAPMLSLPDQADRAAIARRAEIAAEEARLAALRDARRRLEQELEALRQSAEAPARPPGPLAVPQPGAERRALRIVVLHRANSAAAAAAASAVAETLRGHGFEVQALRGTSFVPTTPVVRYFHEADRAAATALAERLGPGWAAQDFRAFQPQPAPQTLEIWLPAS